jgi:hypothetical protein
MVVEKSQSFRHSAAMRETGRQFPGRQQPVARPGAVAVGQAGQGGIAGDGPQGAVQPVIVRIKQHGPGCGHRRQFQAAS